jgi:membrane protease YdiL (CAAX protease family)
MTDSSRFASAPPVDAESFGPPSVPAAASLTYDHALSGISGRWRGILAIVVFVLGFLLVSTVLGGIAIAIEIATGGIDLDQLARGVVPLTPLVMLLNNLSLAACIPLAMVLQRAFFGVRSGSLSSVMGRFRWRWMGRLALIIVPVWAVYVGGSLLLEPAGAVVIDGGVILLLAIVVLTTPLQSAGEEYGARGLILRSAASWFRRPWLAFAVGVIISSTLFSLAHFAADWWLIAYYFVFGASAAFAARGTGGLEAPVLIHATNNVLLFVPAVLYGQLSEGIDRSEGTGGPFILIPMALCVAAAIFSTWWARRNQVIVSAPAPLRIVRMRALPPQQVSYPQPPEQP